MSIFIYKYIFLYIFYRTKTTNHYHPQVQGQSPCSSSDWAQIFCAARSWGKEPHLLVLSVGPCCAVTE